MARVNSQGWEADDDGSLRLAYPSSPGYQEMKSFLNLDSPTTSSFSVSTGEFLHADCHDSSFLLVDSISDAGAFMAATGPSTIDTPESIVASTCSAGDNNHEARLGSSNSIATLPTSITTMTTCTSSNSSTYSRNRRNITPNGACPFSPLRTPDTFTDGGDEAEYSHMGKSQHRCRNSTRPVNNVVKEVVPPSPKPPCSSGRMQTFQPLRSTSHGRSTSSEVPPPSSVLTRDEFEALPPTIQRKVSSSSGHAENRPSGGLGNWTRRRGKGEAGSLGPTA
ncbi:uncharacterized protein MAM_01855 [Metarhizium album ARSEF 1941]|uniref:Uncharacterized protein n=1 Tax=Metarhizium album (strain ARSEF 1941) TaxID=1081103 RepID=A0A0B2WV03_METAS|nr:uncharacterized protein MAM_01855 [Metarhizium album ARSEF 1941]KHN99931.1 hypothetical protein MAM_01855 [Metarhizium album ARSEF 1941]